MPAHIGVRGFLRFSIAFADQYTGFTEDGATFRKMRVHRTEKGTSYEGLTKFGLTPAGVANMAERNLARRERVFKTYQDYRDEMDSKFAPGELMFSPFRTYKTSDRNINANVVDDSKGFQAFKQEWQLYLKPGTEFDDFIKQAFATGWIITLIMGKSDRRLRQLKRIEGSMPGQKQVAIFWSSANGAEL